MSKLIDSSQSSGIKLFGKTIPLLTLNHEEALAHHELSFSGAATREDCCDRKLLSSSNSLGGVTVNSSDGVQLQAQAPIGNQESKAKELLKDEHEDSSYYEIREDLKDATALSGIIENARSDPSAERKSSSLRGSNNGEISETTSSQQEKTLKKPDKILPCPRCNSKETKFCYYNNYNVNQPRHFCKNCQRYWTAGGTMRNVPVGAGRRKTKSSSALHYHHAMISEAIRAAQASAANGIHPNPYCENNNSRVLSFGSDSSIPIASTFNLSRKTHINVQNGIQKPDQKILVENNCLDKSPIIASHSLEKGGKSSLNQSEDMNYQCFAQPFWPFQWGLIQWNTTMIPPTVSTPCFPVSFNPAAAYGNYSVRCPWDVPVASPLNQLAPSSIPFSPTLGKHSRDENILNAANLEKEKPSEESDKSEGRALNSKNLRIDDLGETAKSSMLATFAIKSNKTNNSIKSVGLFDGFQSKSNDERNNRRERLSVLRANPAALSRSLSFHENT